MKRPNLHLTGVPECDKKNESKLEKTLQDIIQENFLNLARQANMQIQEIQRIPLRYFTRKSTPRHLILQDLNKGKTVKGSQKEKSGHLQKKVHQRAEPSEETTQVRRDCGPIFNILKENNFNSEFHIQPN